VVGEVPERGGEGLGGGGEENVVVSGLRWVGIRRGRYEMMVIARL